MGMVGQWEKRYRKRVENGKRLNEIENIYTGIETQGKFNHKKPVRMASDLRQSSELWSP